MDNIFQKGIPLTIAWRLVKPDGTDFNLNGYTHRLFYGVGNRYTAVSSSTVSGNVVSWTFPAESQTAAGDYSLRLMIYQNGKIFTTVAYDKAFSLYVGTSANSQQIAGTNAGNVVSLLTVAEFYALAPVVPTVGEDLYWYANGVKLTDSQGNWISSEHTVEYDAETNHIIIDRGRVNASGRSIEQTITAIAEAIEDSTDAATFAREKAGLANNAATFAREKAELANNAATFAREKAGLANNAATFAREKAELANEKASDAETAAERANEAAAAAEHQVDVKRGYGIQSVTQPVVATTNGGVNTIRVTTEDGKTFDIQVRNGKSSAGFFQTSTALNTTIPSPNAGDYAFVSKAGDETFPAYIYVCTTAGTWSATEKEFTPDDPTDIEDTLESDSITAALSAKQGKVLNSKVSQLGQICNTFDVSETLTSIAADDMFDTRMYINNSNSWARSSYSDAAKYTTLKAGSLLSITAPSDVSVYFALVNEIGTSGSTPSYLLISGRQTVAQNTTRRVLITEDCVLWVWNLINSNTDNHFPQSITVTVVTTDVVLQKNLSFDNAKDKSYITGSKCLVQYEILSTGKFGSSSSYYHFYIPVSPGEKYIITNQDSPSCRYSFATSSVASSGSDIPLVSGTSVNDIQKTDSVLVTIPTGTSFLLVSYYTGYHIITQKISDLSSVDIDLSIKQLACISGQNDETVFEEDTIATQLYVSLIDLTWKTSSLSAVAARYYAVKRGQLVSITSSSEIMARGAFVKSIGPSGANAVFASGYNGLFYVEIGQTAFFLVTEDCYLWIYRTSDGDIDYYPESLVVRSYTDFLGKGDIVDNLTDGGVDKVLSAEQGKELGEDLEKTKKDVETIIFSTYKESFVSESKMTLSALYITASNLWSQSSMSYASRYMPVSKGSRIKITSSSVDCVYALVQRMGPVGDTPQFVQMDSRQTLNANDTIDILVKEDCILFIYYAINASTIIFPEVVKLITPISSASSITRYGVNLLDEEFVSRGSLNSAGEFVLGNNGKVTDFISISISQNTQFLHVCCMNPGVSNFAFNAERVCLYGSNQEYIGAIDDISEAIDKESEENATMFASAQYVRVQFGADRINLYVANNNFSKLPEYSIFDIASLVPTTSYVADQIHNGDGAITRMIDTALDYINILDVLNLGYGDSNTAFDQTVEAVTADPWNSDRYEGEKKQINCSSFVQLCLQGIKYKNSRYVSGSDGHNLVTLYRFDSKSEQNYHNNFNAPGAGGRVIACSNYEKFYANKIAQYAYDRGFLYIINDNFSNVQVGDIIFDGSSSAGAFRGISHCLFVYRVDKQKDGSSVLQIMEVSGTTAHEATRTPGTTSYRYGARFPLPNVSMPIVNIVSSHADSPVEGATASVGSTYTLCDIALLEPIKAHGIYTVVAEVDDLPEGCEIRAYANGSTRVGSYGENLFVRGDNVIVKNFHVPLNSSINTNRLTLEVFVHAPFVGTINLLSVAVYKGYVCA